MIPSGDSFQERHGRLEALYRGRRCLVTGHTGFKGSWLCLWLRHLGAEVLGYALDPPTTPNLFGLARVAEQIRDIRGDVRDAARLSEALHQSDPEIVFHLAAQPIVRQAFLDPKATFDVNVGGTVNLLNSLRTVPSVKSIVVVTSDKCYEDQEGRLPYRESDPLGGDEPYSASKAAAEMAAAAFGKSYFDPAFILVQTARAGNVIGGGDWASDRIIPDAVRALESEQPVPVRNPDSVRPWQHVLDPLYGYLLLGGATPKLSLGVPHTTGAGATPKLSLGVPPLMGNAWNFGPPTTSCRTVRDLVDAFLKVYGSGSWKDASDQQTDAPREARFLTLSWEKAYQRLGWSPRWGFNDTVQRTGAWYRRRAGGADARALCMDDIAAYMAKDEG